MPLRVLYLDHTAKIGGGEIALVNLLRHLDRSVVFPIALLFMEGPLRERLLGCCDTHVIPLADSALTAKKDGLGWRSLLQLRATLSVLLQIWRVAQFARKMEIDLIHTNSLKSDIIGGIAARIAGIPVVWHVRDRIEADYLPKMVVRVFRFLSQNLPDFVIANSSATLASLHLSGKRRSATVDTNGRVVHDGCNVVSIKDGSEGVRTTVRIGLVGRIAPWKGQDIFIRAAALLKEKHPEARFEIIGAAIFAERGYEAELLRLRNELNVNDTVALCRVCRECAGAHRRTGYCGARVHYRGALWTGDYRRDGRTKAGGGNQWGRRAGDCGRRHHRSAGADGGCVAHGGGHRLPADPSGEGDGNGRSRKRTGANTLHHPKDGADGGSGLW